MSIEVLEITVIKVGLLILLILGLAKLILEDLRRLFRRPPKDDRDDTKNQPKDRTQ